MGAVHQAGLASHTEAWVNPCFFGFSPLSFAYFSTVAGWVNNCCFWTMLKTGATLITQAWIYIKALLLYSIYGMGRAFFCTQPAAYALFADFV